MLKKLLKYDWKSVSLLLLILHGVLLIYTLVGRIGISFGLSKFDGTTTNAVLEAYGIAAGLYIFLYVLFIFAIMVTTYVYLAVRFQKNLFSDEGYLTHTLPVSPAKLIWSKMLVSWAWIAIDMVCVIASVLLLLLFKETFVPFKTMFSDLAKILSGAYGVQDQIFLLLFLLTILAQLFGFYTTLALFSMCLGSLFKTHKILGSVVSFFGINIVLSTISTLFMFLVSPSVMQVSDNVNTSIAILSSQNGIFLLTFLWYLILSVVFFLGSRYILSKKLNLE